MDIELKPCPFCGGKAEVLQDTVTTWGLIIHEADCWLAYDEPSHRQKVPACEFGSWNTRGDTRAERTCHNVWDVELTGRLRFECSDCGGVSLEIAPAYCPVCGAKVVKG